MNDLLKIDGFNEAIVGECFRLGERFVLYDFKKIMEILKDQEMTEEDALDFWSHSLSGNWLGEGTPAFLMEQVDA